MPSQLTVNRFRYKYW